MANLTSIIVNNFKSYRGLIELGPFDKFTAIVGSNGCGKSNMMEAVGFALGAPIHSLRARNYGDLIHGASVSQPTATSASVTAVFNFQGVDTRFTCTAFQDECGYMINNQVVDTKEYSWALSKLGVHIGANNFLIYQGEIEYLALKNPKELTQFFERLSSSEDLKPEYDQLQRKVIKQQETLVQTDLKLKDLRQQISCTSSQQKKMKNWIELEKKVLALKKQLCLFRAFHNNRQIEEMQLLSTHLKHSLNTHEVDREDQRRMWASEVSEYLKCEKSVMVLAESIKCKEDENYETTTELLSIKELRHQLKYQLIKASTNLKCAYEAKKKHAHELDLLKKELFSLDNLSDKLDKKMEKEAGIFCNFSAFSEEEKLNISQQYTQLRMQCATKAKGLVQEKITLQRKLQTWNDKLSNNELKLHYEQSQIKLANKNKSELQYKIEFLKKTKNNDRLAELKAEASGIIKQLCILEAQYESESLKKEEVLQKLANYTADKHDIEESEKKSKTIKLLKTEHKGVYDRVANLCSPIDESYNLCVTRAIGGFMDAIVVDTLKTANSCIQLLKNKRIGREIFLPLDNIKGEPMKDLPSDVCCRPIIQLLNCEIKDCSDLISFITKNAVLCETMEVAAKVAYGSATTSRNAVTLDGTIYIPSGLMTGGKESIKQTALKWDARKKYQLQLQYDQLCKSLRDCERTKTLSRRQLVSLNNEISCIESKDKAAMSQFLNLKMEVARLDAQIIELTKKVSQEKNEESEFLAKKSDVIAKLKDVNTKCDAIDDSVFSAFCQQINVNNIRQYENFMENANKKYVEEKQKLKDMHGRVEEQLNYDESKTDKIKENIDRWTKAEKEKTRALEEAKAKHTNLHTMKQSLKLELEQLHVKYGKINSKKVDLQGDVDQLHQALHKTIDKAKEVKHYYDKLLASIEQKKDANFSMLQEFTCQGIQIPLQGAVSMEIDDTENDDGETSEMMLNLRTIIEQRDNLQIDFSSLKPELCRGMTTAKSTSNDKFLVEELTALENKFYETEAVGFQNYQEAGKLSKARAQLELQNQNLRAELANVTKQFQHIKQKRQQLFSDCFKKVSENVDQIYKTLCRSLSCQAYLIPQNSEEPYLDGILFHCIPPSKRFQQMSDMSGGEHILTAMALVFASHCFKKPPFIILDEIDSALDTLNCAYLTQFLQIQSSSIQILIISLNKAVFPKSREIYAVWSSPVNRDDCLNSRIVSFNVGKYHDLCAKQRICHPEQVPIQQEHVPTSEHHFNPDEDDIEVINALRSDSKSRTDPELVAELANVRKQADRERINFIKKRKERFNIKDKVINIEVSSSSKQQSDDLISDDHSTIDIMRGPVSPMYKSILKKKKQPKSDLQLQFCAQQNVKRHSKTVELPTRVTVKKGELIKKVLAKEKKHTDSVKTDLKAKKFAAEIVRSKKEGKPKDANSEKSNDKESLTHLCREFTIKAPQQIPEIHIYKEESTDTKHECADEEKSGTEKITYPAENANTITIRKKRYKLKSEYVMKDTTQSSTSYETEAEQIPEIHIYKEESTDTKHECADDEEKSGTEKTSYPAEYANTITIRKKRYKPKAEDVMKDSTQSSTSYETEAEQIPEIHIYKEESTDTKHECADDEEKSGTEKTSYPAEYANTITIRKKRYKLKSEDDMKDTTQSSTSYETEAEQIPEIHIYKEESTDTKHECADDEEKSGTEKTSYPAEYANTITIRKKRYKLKSEFVMKDTTQSSTSYETEAEQIPEIHIYKEESTDTKHECADDEKEFRGTEKTSYPAENANTITIRKKRYKPKAEDDMKDSTQSSTSYETEAEQIPEIHINKEESTDTKHECADDEEKSGTEKTSYPAEYANTITIRKKRYKPKAEDDMKDTTQSSTSYETEAEQIPEIHIYKEESTDTKHECADDEEKSGTEKTSYPAEYANTITIRKKRYKPKAEDDMKDSTQSSTSYETEAEQIPEIHIYKEESTDTKHECADDEEKSGTEKTSYPAEYANTITIRKKRYKLKSEYVMKDSTQSSTSYETEAEQIPEIHIYKEESTDTKHECADDEEKSGTEKTSYPAEYANTITIRKKRYKLKSEDDMKDTTQSSTSYETEAEQIPEIHIYKEESTDTKHECADDEEKSGTEKTSYPAEYANTITIRKKRYKLKSEFVMKDTTQSSTSYETEAEQIPEIHIYKEESTDTKHECADDEKEFRGTEKTSYPAENANTITIRKKRYKPKAEDDMKDSTQSSTSYETEAEQIPEIHINKEESTDTKHECADDEEKSGTEKTSYPAEYANTITIRKKRYKPKAEDDMKDTTQSSTSYETEAEQIPEIHIYKEESTDTKHECADDEEKSGTEKTSYPAEYANTITIRKKRYKLKSEDDMKDTTQSSTSYETEAEQIPEIHIYKEESTDTKHECADDEKEFTGTEKTSYPAENANTITIRKKRYKPKAEDDMKDSTQSSTSYETEAEQIPEIHIYKEESTDTKHECADDEEKSGTEKTSYPAEYANTITIRKKRYNLKSEFVMKDTTQSSTSYETEAEQIPEIHIYKEESTDTKHECADDEEKSGTEKTSYPAEYANTITIRKKRYKLKSEFVMKDSTQSSTSYENEAEQIPEIHIYKEESTDTKHECADDEKEFTGTEKTSYPAENANTITIRKKRYKPKAEDDMKDSTQSSTSYETEAEQIPEIHIYKEESTDTKHECADDEEKSGTEKTSYPAEYANTITIRKKRYKPKAEDDMKDTTQSSTSYETEAEQIPEIHIYKEESTDTKHECADDEEKSGTEKTSYPAEYANTITIRKKRYKLKSEYVMKDTTQSSTSYDTEAEQIPEIHIYKEESTDTKHECADDEEKSGTEKTSYPAENANTITIRKKRYKLKSEYVMKDSTQSSTSYETEAEQIPEIHIYKEESTDTKHECADDEKEFTGTEKTSYPAENANTITIRKKRYKLKAEDDMKDITQSSTFYKTEAEQIPEIHIYKEESTDTKHECADDEEKSGTEKTSYPAEYANTITIRKKRYKLKAEDVMKDTTQSSTSYKTEAEQIPEELSYKEETTDTKHECGADIKVEGFDASRIPK